MKEKLLNIANTLTLGRLILVPFFVSAAYHEKYLLVILYGVLAALTELDGSFARKYNHATLFGKNFDVAVDSVWILSILIMFVFKGTLYFYQLMIVILFEVVKTLKVISLFKGKKIEFCSTSLIEKMGFVSLAVVAFLLALNIPYPQVFIWIAIGIGLVSMIVALRRKK
ncbi:MAG: CDP-alcohol phosphatidyltransferase family protein [Candidatus Woesearchaeota archaeon]